VPAGLGLEFESGLGKKTARQAGPSVSELKERGGTRAGWLGRGRLGIDLHSILAQDQSALLDSRLDLRWSSLQSLVLWVKESCHLQYDLPFSSCVVGGL
jgi:hypothetical protein